jgi:hypothetical protein
LLAGLSALTVAQPATFDAVVRGQMVAAASVPSAPSPALPDGQAVPTAERDDGGASISDIDARFAAALTRARR